MKKECLNKPAKKGHSLKHSIVAITIFAAFSFSAQSQEALRDGTVAPMGQWLEYREANFRGAPILVHLRTGYERAIVMPEAVELSNNNQQRLPGCEIIVNNNIIAFYPTETFTRRSTVFVGKETGTVYDLRIRASTKGMRQPMRINR
ncbi:MAG: hypothetical protein AB8B87_09040 [Granulosicoccus sp.]